MAEERVEVTLNVPADGALDDLLVTEDTLIVEINEPRNSGENGDSGEATHNLKNLNDTDLERGDYVVDDRGPTPSAEKNTVCITEVTDERIDEHTIDRLGETVYEYNDRSYDPSDRVVKGVYTHLNAEREYSFPASRLRDV